MSSTLTEIPPAQPAADYREAVERIAALRARDDATVNPVARLILLSHHGATERAVVLFHGYTNAPTQYRLLADRLYADGYTVFVPRFPYHGLRDRMTPDQARLTALDLRQVTSEALDIAAGLGRRVIVAGISFGGVMAAWAAQFRPGLHLAMPLAPSFDLPFVPAVVGRAVQRAALRLPNVFLWWDPRTRQRIPGPDYAYPRFATHAVAQCMLLGQVVLHAARTTPPASRRIAVVTTAGDTAINNHTVDHLVHDWRRYPGVQVTTLHFPRSARVFHDMIDPSQPAYQVDRVYPALLRLIEGDGS